METDLPGDGRFVLTERSGNSGLGRIVANTDLDDPSFIEGDVKMFIRRSHKRYLRSKRGIQVWTKIMIRAGRVNATCSSWRLNAISARLELRLLFHVTIHSQPKPVKWKTKEIVFCLKANQRLSDRYDLSGCLMSYFL